MKKKNPYAYKNMNKTKERKVFKYSDKSELEKCKEEINIVDGVSRHILEDVQEKLTSMFNQYKYIEGLVSIHNDMLFDLNNTVEEWHKKNIASAKRIKKLDEKIDKEVFNEK